MSYLSNDKPRGLLRTGWSASVNDYAIAGVWALGGHILAVGDAAGGLFGFDGTSGKKNWEQDTTHEGGILTMALHPNGKIFATGGQDGRVIIWNANNGQIHQSINLGNGWVENIEWSKSGQWLAISISRRVHVYNADGVEVWRSADHPSTISAIAWSNEQLATACYGRVAFFSASSGEVQQKLEWKGSLVSMVLSPDGDIVVCGSQDNSIHFWRRSTGDDSMMSGYPTKPSVLVFDETGTLLATGGSSSVTIWTFEGDGPEGTEPVVLELHIEPITTLAFAKKGKRLASGARDGAVVLWSLQSDGDGGAIGAALVGDIIAQLIWRPDGRSLAALDARGGVTVWRVGT